MISIEELVTIIVPIYNADKYLACCIESIIEQSYQNIEIILIDDGSTDNSLEICNEYRDLDNRIKVISKKNTGVSDTRNLGVENATGQYILFVDSDDYVENSMIEEMLKAITTNNVDVARCKAKVYVNEKDFIIENFGDLENCVLRKNDLMKQLYRFVTYKSNIPCYTPTLLIKKEKMIKFNTDFTYMEDTDFYIRLLCGIDSMVFLNKSLYNYRYNENSASKSHNNIIKNIICMFEAQQRIETFLNQQKVSSEELHADIEKTALKMILKKIELLSNLNVFTMKQELKNVFTVEKVYEILMKYQGDFLPITKKIELLLAKKRCYLLLAFFIKFKSYIR